MAIEVEIDVQVLKSEIKKTYASVSQEPEKDFIFPTGRPWAEDLGYPEELANVPETAVRSFAGVANPWQLGRLKAGERVLDLGSGAGTDSLVAAQMVGEDGHVTGIDMTPEMLTKARSAADEMAAANVEYVDVQLGGKPSAAHVFEQRLEAIETRLGRELDAVAVAAHRPRGGGASRRARPGARGGAGTRGPSRDHAG
jgi:SAM-dependent methyltransferase